MSISKNFEDAIKVTETSSGNFTANISDNWSIGQTANGGYSMSLLAKACSEYLDHKDPLVLSANYIDRVEFGPADIEVSKISIVGIGMRSHSGIAQTMFKTLGDENINIKVISTSEIKISVLIHRKNLKKAIAALHKEFKLEA